MSTTKMTSTGPSLRETTKTPTNGPDDQAAPIAESAAEIQIVSDNANPELAPPV